MFDKYLTSTIRHGLSGLGGVLVTIGVNEGAAHGLLDALTPVLVGVISYGIGQAWSLVDKEKDAKRE